MEKKLLREEVQFMLLESNLTPSMIDEIADAIYNNYDKVKQIVSDIVEGEIKGKGVLFGVAMKQCSAKRIKYEESELIAATIAEMLETMYMRMFNG